MSTTESGDGWAVVMAVYGMIDDNPKFPERCQITEFGSSHVLPTLIASAG